MPLKDVKNFFAPQTPQKGGGLGFHIGSLMVALGLKNSFLNSVVGL